MGEGGQRRQPEARNIRILTVLRSNHHPSPAMDDELERFKREINLVHYARTCGYTRDPRESSQASVVMRKQDTDDKIVIARNIEDEHWVYFSVRDDADNGSIIDFVQRRRGLSLGHVRRELRPWIGGRAPVTPPDLQALDVQALRKDRARVLAEFSKADLVDNSTYLNRRGVRPATLASARFTGTFRVDSRGSVLFPHHDDEGLCGFEVKNSGYTGFAKSGRKTIWCSRTTAYDRRLVLVESAIDALSYHQLTPSTDTRYISIGGQPSADGRQLIARSITKMPGDATVVLAFDRDAGGDKLAAMVEALVPRVFVREVPPGDDAQCKDWNDYLQIVEREFIKALTLPDPRAR